MYRIFIDEVGNHDLKSCDDLRHRYLGLTGVIMELDYEEGAFTDRVNVLKQDVFPDTSVVLHRREIIDHTPPFECLDDPATCARFDTQLLDVINTAQYDAITAVIDKLEHKQRYAVWRFHPYHYCLTVVLERYVQWLARNGRFGDVLAESRGKKEDMQLARAYRYIHDNGSDHVDVKLFQERLTSREIKLRSKTANVAGLQLADVIANPACRHLICVHEKQKMTAPFGIRIVNILIRKKYVRNPYSGQIRGWGVKWLP